MREDQSDSHLYGRWIMKGTSLRREDFPPLLQIREYVNARYGGTVIVPSQRNYAGKKMHIMVEPDCYDDVHCHTCIQGEWNNKPLPTLPFEYKEWCTRCVGEVIDDIEAATSYDPNSEGTFCKECRQGDTETVLTELDSYMSLTVRCKDCGFIVRSTTKPEEPILRKEGYGRCISV